MDSEYLYFCVYCLLWNCAAGVQPVGLSCDGDEYPDRRRRNIYAGRSRLVLWADCRFVLFVLQGQIRCGRLYADGHEYTSIKQTEGVLPACVDPFNSFFCRDDLQLPQAMAQERDDAVFLRKCRRCLASGRFAASDRFFEAGGHARA